MKRLKEGMMFFLTWLVACQSNAIKVDGSASSRGDASVFLSACGQQNPTAIALQKAVKTTDCEKAWLTLSTVTELSMNGAGLSDLSPIAGMINLEKIAAYGNGISDLSPLSKLSHLSELRLMKNQIVDIAPLQDLLQLTVLRLDGNQIVDISLLPKLQRLERLGLDSNQISDFRPLAELTEIQSMNTNFNPADPDKCPVEGPGPKQLYKHCKRVHKYQAEMQDAIDPKQ